MMMWTITKDSVHAAEDKVTMVGRGWFRDEKYATRPEQMAQMTDEFRLLDGDDEVYFEGLCKDLDDQCGDSAFSPMDSLGAAFGCVSMQHRKRGSSGKWAEL